MNGISLTTAVKDEMVAHCLAAYPLEGCGLLAGAPNTAAATKCYPTANAAPSARVYTVHPKDMLRADRDADENGLEIMAVFHSHTHTEAYPSPTDVAQAPVPDWHYLLVSFEDAKVSGEGDVTPVVRSFRIVDGNIHEEPVVLVG